eukprot:scaffold39847_cov19-Tisochrysis_lutea.AAC.2
MVSHTALLRVTGNRATYEPRMQHQFRFTARSVKDLGERNALNTQLLPSAPFTGTRFHRCPCE